jgi:hypothetical protein
MQSTFVTNICVHCFCYVIVLYNLRLSISSVVSRPTTSAKCRRRQTREGDHADYPDPDLDQQAGKSLHEYIFAKASESGSNHRSFAANTDISIQPLVTSSASKAS